MFFTTDVRAGYMEIMVEGDIGVEDYENAVRANEEVLASNDRVNVVAVVQRVGTIPLKLWFRDLKYVMSRLSRFGRCAMVTDKGWISPVAKIFSALTSVEMRTFPLVDLEAGRAWARGNQTQA
ncbi:MAG: STAS/SEC14 domain-containing protein [Alphaproteobacteria bacterium]|nr:STAS/SEC14 domain-containing protein [Alphaproteobacteria bacterium]